MATHPLSRSPGGVAAILLVAGPVSLCRCALHCQGVRQQLAFHCTSRHGLSWASGYKLNFPNTDASRQNDIYEMHNSPWCGVVGVKRIKKAIEWLYTWQYLKYDVEHM